MDIVNNVRVRPWQKQPRSFFEQTAKIDADGSLVSTDGECKDGMGILRMDFRTFIQRMILIPVQILRSGRTLIFKLLAWRADLPILFRALDAL